MPTTRIFPVDNIGAPEPVTVQTVCDRVTIRELAAGAGNPMCRKLLFIVLAILCLAGMAQAQFTQVSGTITDPNGLPYSPATINATLSPPGVTSPTVNRQSFSASLNGSTSTAGTFSMTLADNNVVLPAGTRWQFTVCATPGVAPPFGLGSVCFTSTITITGATQSITTQLSAAAPSLVRTLPIAGVVGGSGGKIIIQDGFTYPYTRAGLQAAINTFGTSQDGGLIIIPRTYDLGSTTISVGTTGTGDNMRQITLWFFAVGTWTCSADTAGCLRLGSRSHIMGLGRFSRIHNTNAVNGTSILVPHSAETWSVKKMRIDGGVIGIDTQGTTPNGIIEEVMMDGVPQAIRTQTFVDFASMRNIFINGPGAAVAGSYCWQSGQQTDAAGEVGMNNVTVSNFFCQNVERGFNMIPLNTNPARLFASILWESLQFLNIGREAIRIRTNGSGPWTIQNSLMNNIGTQAANTYDAFDLAGDGLGTQQGFSILGMNGNVALSRNGINWTCGANCRLDGWNTGGATASMLLSGPIIVSNSPGTFNAASVFNSTETFLGQIRFGNNRDATNVVELSAGTAAAQIMQLSFLDRTTRRFNLIKDASNDLLLEEAAVGDVLKVNRNGSLDGAITFNRYFRPQTLAFAALGAPANGSMVFCSDCTIANPCAGAGTGAIAKRLNGVWVCN